MTKPQWLLSGIFLAGLIILILPDKGNAIIRFNEFHGPSFLDIVGLVLIAISWLTGLIIIFKNRGVLKKKLGKRNILLLSVTYLFSCSAIVWALMIKKDSILWVSVSIASIVNILFIVIAFTSKRHA